MNSQPNSTVDVLHHHHQVNGHPSTPDPQALASIQPQLAGTQESAHTWAPWNSKKVKEVIPSSKNLGFYPSVWQGCLEDAKQECRVSHLLTSNLFPSKSRDLKTLIMEALTTTISEWNDNGVAFEPGEFYITACWMFDLFTCIGYWPNHKTGMTCIVYQTLVLGDDADLEVLQLLGDMSTWCSDLKTIAFTVCPVAYNLIHPQEIPPQGRAQWVQNSTAKLLIDSLFLQDGFDEQV